MILLELLILIFLLYIIALLSYSMMFGAPFTAIGKVRMDTMLTLLKIQRGKRLLDIGSGDGRIVIAAAKKGAIAYGYEINPVLVALSRFRVKQVHQKQANIVLRDYWKCDFSKFDYICVWGVGHIMGRLERKLREELPPNAKVVSNHFTFPNWKYTKKKNDVYLYVQN